MDIASRCTDEVHRGFNPMSHTPRKLTRPHGRTSAARTREPAMEPLCRYAKTAQAWEALARPDAILATNPDLFIFLGDNVYLDTRDVGIMRRKYAELAAQPGFQRRQPFGHDRWRQSQRPGGRDQAAMAPDGQHQFQIRTVQLFSFWNE